MLIFLIGMMGSGKTTLGRQLAERLGYAFVDLDEYLEKRVGRSIAEVFEQEGQERFRELEREALEAVVLDYDDAVISTGGGAPCFFDNIDFINRHGVSCFLDVPVEEISRRLLASNLQVRPLLAGKSEEEVSSFLAKTLSLRKQFYEQANIQLKGPAISVEQLQHLLNNN
ncbi:shikimate kinase [Pontibacter diazotrophicus]|uniref:Shikimate kinase n=1 Tax=Pontibacter diazotrophicus TaxID=1400979 RepID=A0A3D8KZ51_9BACT|nr:shikimate kinase [Pontibacter diazotrophicus]RDV10396.1 shikimate kinase [Pontibacter diazotrophicus]